MPLQGESKSPPSSQLNPEHNNPPPLGKFQHTDVSRGIKNLCSMNMNEFLTGGMWTAEEIPNQEQSFDSGNVSGVTSSSYLNCDQENSQWHGSHPLQASQCQTAVEEQVWPGRERSEMADRGYYNRHHSRQNARTAETTPLQVSFRDITTEDSLVKEGDPTATSQQQQPSSRVLYWNSAMLGFAGNYYGTMNEDYAPAAPPQQPVRVLNAGEEQVDNGTDGGSVRRQRPIATPKRVKEVERRERRLMKKRESAVRLRARKQAYAVELQAELNLLQKENAQLKQAMHHEEMKMKDIKKIRSFRRSSSCPLWNK